MRRSLFVLLLLAAAIAPAQASAADRRSPERVADSYIVVLDPSVPSVNREAKRLERKEGFKTRFRYGHALKGFAARLSPAQREALEAHPAVEAVVPDLPVRALDTLNPGDRAPAGIQRTGAADGTTIRGAANVRVAVIDTGIDFGHSDLDAVEGKNCVNSTPGASAQDDEGHGTHVAGTIAARNDGQGVVGVAAGTKLVAVKVLNSNGSGTTSQVVCGIDYVTSTRTDSDPANDIAVANMSLGGGGYSIRSCAETTDPEHKAICRSTDAGVVYAVAAGNSGWDFDYASYPDVPAAYPQVVTVSAMADTDGRAGWLGSSPSCRSGEADDRYASFSNYASTAAGERHTLAAPGVCVESARLGGGLTTMSGTSMATPHVAGALALCISDGACSGVPAGDPAGYIQRLASTDAGYGFTRDPQHSPVAGRYYGYLEWSGAQGTSPPPPPPPPPPPIPVSAAPGSTALVTGTFRSGSAASLSAADSAYYEVNSTTSGTRTSAWYGAFDGVASTLSNLKVTYRGKNSRSCSQTVSLYRWSDGAWVTLDSRSVGTSEVTISRAATGTLSNYVSGSGELRVRVRCTRSSSGSFYASGNQLRIDYDKPA
jgi:subtilisin